MAGLFLVRASDRGRADAAFDAARAQFGLSGFSGLSDFELPGWRGFHAPHILGGPDSLHRDGADFIAVAGTLTYDGLMGRPALAAMLRDTALPSPDWSRIAGQFVALIHRGGRSFLLTDYFAAFQLFHDEGRTLFSTSLLAAAQAVPRLSFDPQGVYEFAFNVVPIGTGTVFSELRTQSPYEAVELVEDGTVVHDIGKPLPDAAAQLPLEERLAAHRDRLLAVVGDHVRFFGDKVFCPLSGGLDSRLVLAALRAEGCRPTVYVYGDANSADVRIARTIGAAEGFEVEWLDKEGARELTPDEFPEQVERNFHQYDGLPNYGELFENGANAAARDARHAGGALSVSGGCGEVFRNFFFLPNRRFTAAAVARTFFARYAKDDATEAFDERAFLDALEGKILAMLGRSGEPGPLDRAVIEQIYPRVRCHSLFGREISLEGRHGAYLMPFLDHRLVAEAVKLPLALKDAGRFEAMLLAAIDPVLARHMSAYGHDFAGPPSLSHRLGEASTRLRPVWLRQRSYAFRRRAGPVADEHGGLLSPDYMGRVVDLDYPAMRRFFRVDRIGDSGMMRRIANLEYLTARLPVSSS
ncbi:MAG: hypothetical protein ACT4N8_03205 [Sphingosinicella sp.]|uniref:hypothetical protein n=1 Tax=Sphingosinicella sp. TaxID=1917971 RepID=UPI0040382334